jgi:hypothetical protein
MVRFSIVAICQLLAISLYGGRQPTARDGEIRLRLQIILHVVDDRGDAQQVRTTAARLLATAGIVADWRECDAVVTRCEPLVGPDAVNIRLLPTGATTSPQCGLIVRDGRTSTILMYVVRHRELVWRIRHSPAGRAEPALSMLEVEDVTGLAIAHEVGHFLNLHHSHRGVMQAVMGPDELVALRRARLSFTTEESAAIRRSAQLASDQTRLP